VVRAIKTDAYSRSALGDLIEEIKTLSNLNFLSFECVFIGRECNGAAHELIVLGHLCAEGEETVSCSMPDSVSIIIANHLLANE
jgi:hypothetical protein